MRQNNYPSFPGQSLTLYVLIFTRVINLTYYQSAKHALTSINNKPFDMNYWALLSKFLFYFLLKTNYRKTPSIDSFQFCQYKIWKGNSCQFFINNCLNYSRPCWVCILRHTLPLNGMNTVFPEIDKSESIIKMFDLE